MLNGLLSYNGRQTGKANLQVKMLCHLAEHGHRVVVAHPTTKPVRLIDLFSDGTAKWVTDAMFPIQPPWEAIEMPLI